MNTTKRYLREIRYRQARCCSTCQFCVQKIEGVEDLHYCIRHDNSVRLFMVCKEYKKWEVEQDGQPSSNLS